MEWVLVIGIAAIKEQRKHRIWQIAINSTSSLVNQAESVKNNE